MEPEDEELKHLALTGGVLVGVAVIAGGGFEPRRPPVDKDIVFVVPSSSRSCWLSTRPEDLSANMSTYDWRWHAEVAGVGQGERWLQQARGIIRPE